MVSNPARTGNVGRSRWWPLLGAFLAFTFLLPGLAGAKVSIQLKLDRAEATLADPIRMVVRVTGTRSGKAKPAIQGLEGFSVTRSGTSSRLEIMNGQVNAGIDYTYFLQAKKGGTFQIGPAEVKYKGKTYRSNTESLTIVEPTRSPGADRGPVFLSAKISPEKVYVEEQTVYTIKLHRQVRVGDISLSLPESEALSFKQLGKPIEYRSVYNGQSYQVLEVRYALLPSRKGNFTIGPSSMNLTVFRPQRGARRGLFDDPFFQDPFFSSGRPVTVSSEPLELQVLPLPADGKPPDFSGLVGSFHIDAKLEPTTMKAGDSATLTIVLSGRGNVNRMPDLQVPELNNIKVYADQPVLEVKADGKGLAGVKTMRWALVPEQGGPCKIPPISVSFFDTKSREYRLLESPIFSLLVLPGESRQIQASAESAVKGGPSEPSKQEVEELGRDILPIHTSLEKFTAAYTVLPSGFLLSTLLLSPPLVYALALFGTRVRRRSVQTAVARRAKRAARSLLQKYRQGGLSCHGMNLAIRDYLNDRFHLSLGSLTSVEGAEILKENGVSTGTVENLRSIIQGLEDAIYTGNGNEPWDMERDIPQLIKQIEKEAR